MRKIVLLFCVFLAGCSSIKSELIKSHENDDEIAEMVKKDDINEWDIPLDQIESVVICDYTGKREWAAEIPLDEEDGYRLIEAFNAIQNGDIYSKPDYGMSNSAIRIKLKNNEEDITISYEPLGMIYYKGGYYLTRYQIEFYEVMREIEEEYQLGLHEFESFLIHTCDEKGYGGLMEKNNLILSPNKSIKEIMDILGYDYRVNSEMTFNDILKEYDGKLEVNDIIKIEQFGIQILEFNEEKEISAISVERD